MKPVILLWVLVCGIVTETAWAFTYEVNRGCRDGRIIRSRTNHLLLNEVSFPTGSAAESSFRSALEEFNTDIIGSRWRWSNGKDNDQIIAWPDGRSEVAFTVAGQYPCIANTPACAITHYESEWSWSEWCTYLRYVNEADIFYNNAFTWSASQIAPPLPTESIKGIALHELGHALTLGHEGRQIATMGAGVRAHFGADRNDPQIHSDDKTAVRFLYGDTTSTEVDVAAHGFFQSVTNTEYGQIEDLDLVPRAVPAGGTTRVRYTVENHGPQPTTFRVSFELGTPGNWALAGTSTVTLPGGFMGTFFRFLTVPAGLPGGQDYQVRIVADDNQLLTESNETNNEVILRNRLRVN